MKDYPQNYLVSVASNVPATAQHVTQPGQSQGSVIPKALYSGYGFLLPKGLCLNSSLLTIPSFTFPHILQTSIHTSRTQRSFFLHFELHKSLQFLRTSVPVLTLFTRAVLLNVFSHMYLPTQNAIFLPNFCPSLYSQHWAPLSLHTLVAVWLKRP